MKIIKSPFRNPFINLAFEDYFLRSFENLPLIFFYVNRPCVVYGRFQNPWLESNLEILEKFDIWPVRRQSGGGCVFHDEGNLNFSFITPENRVERKKFSLLLMEALSLVGVELVLSERNDLWMSDSQGVLKKISGSAYKQTKRSSFHHGTLLVSSDLDLLEASLQKTLDPTSSLSTASVRSQVMTLNQVHREMTIDDIVELVKRHLEKVDPNFQGQEELNEELLLEENFQKSFEHLRSWDWLWGETPHFEIETMKGRLQVRKGIVVDSGMKFEANSMRKYFLDHELKKIFPDFSGPNKLSNQIF